MSTESKLLLVKGSRFKLLKVKKNCELADFIQAKKLDFHKGAVFYEFKRTEEDINPDKEVILMKEVKMQFFWIIISQLSHIYYTEH